MDICPREEETAMTATMERIAHEHATRATIRDMAMYLQSLFGQKLTATIAGVKDPKAVGQWARGEQVPHPGAERRLRDAYHVASLLMQVEHPQTVRSWFMGMNPQLDDRAPALVVGEDPVRVLQAARAFLAGG